MPKFSVIVPIYKVESYLRQCIESILEQTYEDFELILVDDGSPDNCPAICDEYAEKDSRIQAIHKENGGIASARTAGAKKATGDYICCVDGDDWIHPDYLKKFADVILEKEPDVICCGTFLAYEDKTISSALPFSYGFYTKEDIEKEFFPFLIEDENAIYFPVSIWNKTYKRGLFLDAQCEISTNIKIGEDAACTLPMLYKAESAYILEECLYYYRQNPTSMTKKKKAFAWDGPKLLCEHLGKKIDLTIGDFKDQLYRRTVHDVFTVAVSQFYRQESYFTICRDIKTHLKDPVYVEAIRHARYKGFSGRMALFALKYRIMWLLKFWSIVKHV